MHIDAASADCGIADDRGVRDSRSRADRGVIRPDPEALP
jgi:hypothetical protein